MYIDEEEIQLVLWHLGNSLDKCEDDGIQPPADSDGLLHQLSIGVES